MALHGRFFEAFGTLAKIARSIVSLEYFTDLNYATVVACSAKPLEP